ncbi:hypothetical protein [Conservatibacter flavescens]|uniref:Uncharacterized protein n=1 Tax=Conservatibacter flavescens TaxID=28161 RepID=A0A2M8S0V5_9PAST|nr:hypothetical protein [Conservatibacter flavescens]PJG84780.1 hypothetical protein CVP05_09590 [Conservatibacter flavescens]
MEHKMIDEFNLALESGNFKELLSNLKEKAVILGKTDGSIANQKATDFINVIELMRLNIAILYEYQLHNERYQAWYDSNESDEEMKTLIQESERIIKQLYRIKYGIEPSSNPSHWLAFWGGLSENKLI